MSTKKANTGKAKTARSEAPPFVDTEKPSHNDLLADGMSKIQEAKSISWLVGNWLSEHANPTADERARASLALVALEELLDSAYSAVDNAWLRGGTQS